MINKKKAFVVFGLAITISILAANYSILNAEKKEIGSNYLDIISQLVTAHKLERSSFFKEKGVSLVLIDDKFVKCDVIILKEKVGAKEKEVIFFEKGTKNIIHKRVYFRDIENSKYEYSVYLDQNDNLTKYVVVLPQNINDLGAGIKVFHSEVRYYAGKGKLTGRFISEVEVDYNKSSARFHEFRYGGDGEIISQREGNAPFHEYEENSSHKPQ